MISIFILIHPRGSKLIRLNRNFFKTKCAVLPGPGHFIPAGATCHLQDEVPFIGNFPQAFGQGREIRIPRPKRNRACAQQAILDMNASHPFPVGSKFFARGIAQGRAVPGIIIDLQEWIGQSGQKFGKPGRVQGGFQMDLNTGLPGLLPGRVSEAPPPHQIRPGYRCVKHPQMG